MNETTQQLSQAETNRLIRADLKACFPGTRFTVRAANGAGITQTVIGWEIGYRPSSADFDGYYSPPPACWPPARPRRKLTPWLPDTAPGNGAARTA